MLKRLKKKPISISYIKYHIILNTHTYPCMVVKPPKKIFKLFFFKKIIYFQVCFNKILEGLSLGAVPFFDTKGYLSRNNYIWSKSENT